MPHKSIREKSSLIVMLAAGWGLCCRAEEPAGQALSPSVVRWFPSREALDRAVPSHALLGQPKAATPAAPTDFPYRPTYAKGEEGRTDASFAAAPGDSYYGVGRHPGSLLRNGEDFGGGPVHTPWVLCVREDGTSYGVFADTTHAAGVSLKDGIRFSSDDADLPLVIIRGDSPREVVVGLNEITGRMEMPPIWALGYQQFAAYSNVHLQLAMKWLREAEIPSSALWLGVEEKGVPLNYPSAYVPDVKGIAAEAKDKGFHLVGLVGRAVPDMPYSVQLAPATNGGHLLKYEDGNLHREEYWEKVHLIPDYTRKETRDWWSGLVGKFLEPGISGIVSLRLTQDRLPREVRLNVDPELGGPGSALRYQEVLETQFARAVWDGFGGEKANRRPFVMVDARAIGSQRWTGTIVDWPESKPEWPRMFIDAALNASLSGQPFLATIVKPPFQGEGSDRNLRWIGVAATFPVVFGSFFLPEDLSTFPQPAQKVIRQAMERRARLIPYIYTQCFNGFFECEPILKPLFFANPKDPALRGSDAGFLVGNDLLVVPRLADGPRPPVPLPGAWKRLDFGDSDNPLLPDLYLRPGAVLALGPVVQYPGQRPVDPVTIVANPDESGTAEGHLYEDSGEGFEFYRNQARRVGYRITRQDDAYFARLGLLDFGLPLPNRKLEVRILTEAGELRGEGSERGTVKIPIPNSEKR
jgi:alpha-glucosidase